MVHVSHNGHYRRSFYQVFRIINDLFIFVGFRIQVDEFHLTVEFTGHQLNHFRIQALVDRHHDTQAHTFADDFRKRHIQQIGEFAHGDKLGHLQYTAVILHF